MSKTWIAQVKAGDKHPFWVGNFKAPGRAEAKRAARLFVSEILPLDTKILAIAEGEISVRFDSEPFVFDEVGP